MNIYKIIYYWELYTIFKNAKIVLTVTNVGNRGTFACRAVTTIENRNMNATLFWNIQIFHKFGTYKSMDLWNGHLNLWINGRNILIYGYIEGKFVHTNAHQIRNIQINGLMYGTL